MDKSEQAFWETNFVDMGLHDVPSFIDYILAETGQEQLTYIGHSQGTAQAFAGASLMPEYWTEKVNLFVALAPIARIDL